MNLDPSIAIVIPVYNVEKYLKKLQQYVSKLMKKGSQYNINSP